MSNRYKGGIISATPPTTTGGESGTASGAWTLEQQMQLQAAGLWPLQPTPKYIEDVFSTWLYTGNGSTQTITNGIDLSGNGGLVWLKGRNIGSNNVFLDTIRGVNSSISSNNNDAAVNPAGGYVSAFNTTGFSLGSNITANGSTYTYASWTFREQPKFFDVVTWTGNGANYRAISHSLGSTPGCVIVKSTSASGAWAVWHQSVDPKNLILNSTSGAITGQFSIQDVGATTFAVANSSFYGFPQSIPVNDNGATYVAYVFANNAGGFGLTGTDNVISCGSFTGASPATINLGYEPQWLLLKSTTNVDDWYMFDTMRGWTADFSGLSYLRANLSDAEATGGSTCPINSTGFQFNYGAGQTFIYIAIRRGPMKVPTSGTSVFLPSTAPATTPFDVGFPPDLALWSVRDSTGNKEASSRLQGAVEMFTNTTGAETSVSGLIGWNIKSNFWYQDITGGSMINWMFRRAPSFCDVVCYTGTGSLRTVTHNLAAVPELIIVKRRSASNSWYVYNSTIGAANALFLNGTTASTADNAAWNSTSPTSTVFTVNTESAVNFSGQTYVAYLFATCAGVSKVGSYTGTGAAQTINCGFTAGSRFVMIKRTDSTGDWYVWDSARGIIPSNDPYLLINSSAAEVTGTDYVDTTNVGFDITSTAPAAINANGGTFIFLAIA